VKYDPKAFAALFDRHAREIHRYDTSRTDARPWLYGIATNLVARHRRAEARRLRTMSAVVAPAGAEPMADTILARLTARTACRDVATTLAGMPAKHRDVVLLYAWAELEYDEIAHALGVPVGTVRSRLSRARQTLRKVVPGDG